MNRKNTLGLFFILALVLMMTFTNGIFAQKTRQSLVAAAPTASTTLVLSQVYGGGGGSTGTYLNDYVEIKNISTTAQSLNGLSLYYGSATGKFASSATNAFALPNVTLSPGQYFLVQLGGAGTAGAALPTPDATTTNLSMSGTSGKVALVTASALAINTCGDAAAPCSATQLAAFVDWVAYGAAGNGTAGNGEGGTSVNNNTALTSTQGAVRKNGGCTDTDNNNLDFDVITAPVPRNTATTPAPCGSVTPANVQHVIDFNGDGKTDYSVVRNMGSGASGQLRWYIYLNGINNYYGADFGLAIDSLTPVDFDGDKKTDIAVWRSGASGVASFYILQSTDNTVKIDAFGQEGDDPSVVGDYDGDGKADVAVYRDGATSGAQSFWYYRGTLNNAARNITFFPWGSSGDTAAPGDYDGDGKNDFVVERDGGDGQSRYFLNKTTGSIEYYVAFGRHSDAIVPGDYDGDGKTDIAVARDNGSNYEWYYRSSINGSLQGTVWGNPTTDYLAQGDYDGDGKTDFAIWRTSNVEGGSAFWIKGSSGNNTVFQFGQGGDIPVANYNEH